MNLNNLKDKLNKKNIFSVLKSAGILILLSIVITLVIEIMQRGSLVKATTFVTAHFTMFLLNITIVLSITSLAFLFKKTKAVYTVIAGLVLIFGIAGAVVMKFRGSPFTAADIYSIKDGLAIAGEYLGLVEIILMALILIGFIIGIIILFKKEKKNDTFSYVRNIVFLIIPAILCTVVAYKYNREKDNIKLYRWDLTSTYGVNGYLVSFIDSAKELIPNKPETYSEVRVDEIKTKMDEEIQAVSGNTKKPNIIVVQLESFIDPYRLKGVEFSEDPMPNIRKIQEKGPNGLIRVPSFGGGTVRSEFEVLTGYSANNLGPGEIPNNTILRKQPVESMAYILKNQGYDVTAIHNYTGNFYNRDEVYANFGFDKLVTKEYMDDLQMKYDYPSDMNNLVPIEDLMKSDNPQFIFNVAVESHGPYDDDYAAQKYTVSGDISEIEKNQIQEYLDKAKEVDDYVGALIDYVEKSGEPTVIAMYGDHLPALDVVYDPANYPSDQKYDTEYFIWSNTGIKPIEKDIQAYQLSTYIFDVAGIQGGMMPSFHKAYSSNAKYDEYLKDIQYDQLYGENYLLDKDLYKKTDIQLGLEPIKVTKAIIEGNQLTIEGENLTRASVVLVNGKPIKTTYDNGERIIATGFDDNIKTIEVGQEGMYGKMLSKTPEIEVTK
jgi:phosphoglycerol transferase MdoB-like AlkP superfamily enzyme